MFTTTLLTEAIKQVKLSTRQITVEQLYIVMMFPVCTVSVESSNGQESHCEHCYQGGGRDDCT